MNYAALELFSKKSHQKHQKQASKPQNGASKAPKMDSYSSETATFKQIFLGDMCSEDSYCLQFQRALRKIFWWHTLFVKIAEHNLARCCHYNEFYL